MLKFGCCLASPNKNFGYAPGCTASIYQKISWFVFDLIYVVLLLVAVHFISELTKFELFVTIFEHHNYVYLSPTLRINVFSY